MTTQFELDTSRQIGALGQNLEVSPGIELHY